MAEPEEASAAHCVSSGSGGVPMSTNRDPAMQPGWSAGQSPAATVCDNFAHFARSPSELISSNCSAVGSMDVDILSIPSKASLEEYSAVAIKEP